MATEPVSDKCIASAVAFPAGYFSCCWSNASCFSTPEWLWHSLAVRFRAVLLMFSLADASNILNAPTFSDLACSLIEDAVIWPEIFLRAIFLKSSSRASAAAPYGLDTPFVLLIGKWVCLYFVFRRCVLENCCCYGYFCSK